MPKRAKLRVKLFSHAYLGFSRDKRDETMFRQNHWMLRIDKCKYANISLAINSPRYKNSG